MNVRDALKKAKRVVVKVGTSTITRENGASNLARMEEIVREIVGLKDEGREMVLVTSGAIAAGMNRMGLSVRPKGVPERQALAAVGQGVLMHLYETLVASYGQTAGQVHLTKENSLRHNQYTNPRNARLALLDMGVVPVVNEHDADSVDEL
jgi:glutamate 5-kinase